MKAAPNARARNHGEGKKLLAINDAGLRHQSRDLGETGDGGDDRVCQDPRKYRLHDFAQLQVFDVLCHKCRGSDIAVERQQIGESGTLPIKMSDQPAGGIGSPQPSGHRGGRTANSRADKNDGRRFYRPLACELTKLRQGAVDCLSGDLAVAQVFIPAQPPRQLFQIGLLCVCVFGGGRRKSPRQSQNGNDRDEDAQRVESE